MAGSLLVLEWGQGVMVMGCGMELGVLLFGAEHATVLLGHAKEVMSYHHCHPE
jgi:hypothetical protein